MVFRADISRPQWRRDVLDGLLDYHVVGSAMREYPRLVFDRNELRVSREAQRLAGHREELLTRVAQLYYARRRMQVDAVLQPEAPAAVDRALEIEELTAVLDGLTDNALSGGKPSR